MGLGQVIYRTLGWDTFFPEICSELLKSIKTFNEFCEKSLAGSA